MRRVLSVICGVVLLAGGLRGQSVTLLGDLNPAGDSNPEQAVQAGELIYFTATDAEAGRELWVTDLTPAGTRRVRDIRPGPEGSEPERLYDFGGVLVFTADDGEHGRELWRSDGTEAGTWMIRDINAGEADGGINHIPEEYEYPAFLPRPRVEFAQMGGHVYFSADDGEHGSELWRSDGRAEGTELVVETAPGAQEDPVVGLVAYEGLIYYFQRVPQQFGEDWRWMTDGTPGKPAERGFSGPDRYFYLLKVVNGRLYCVGNFSSEDAAVCHLVAPGDFDVLQYCRTRSRIVEIGSYGEHVYCVQHFRWDDESEEAHNISLYHLNPEEGTAHRVTENDAGYPMGRTEPIAGTDDSLFIKSNGGLYLTTGTTYARWVHGTPAGRDGVVLNGRLIFIAYAEEHGIEPWISDGTRSGTYGLADLNEGPGHSQPEAFVCVGDRVLFRANDGKHGPEIYLTDGTWEGTVLVQDLNPAEGVGSNPTPVKVIGEDRLLFSADDGQRGRELWLLRLSDNSVPADGWREYARAGSP